jgi:long-chain acyl-CoA synthetase
MTFAAQYAAKRPDELALRGPDLELTWAQVDVWLRRAVTTLLSLDLGEARRVAIVAENSAATLLTYVAATLAGTSAVATNFHLEPAELAFVLKDSCAAAVLTDSATAARARAGAELAGVTTIIENLGASGTGSGPETGSGPRQGGAARTGGAARSRNSADANGAEPTADTDANDAKATPGTDANGAEPTAGADASGGEVAAGAAVDPEPPTDHPPLPTLVYTSGSTGRPKGVQLPPTSWVGGATIDEHVARLAQNSMIQHGRHLVSGPMYHSGPLAGTRLFLGGAPTTVLHRFDAQAWLEAVQRDRIGSTIMVPTHFQRLLNLPAEHRERYDTSSLRFVLQVGAKCPVEVKRAMFAWLGDVIWESYGASEVGTTCLIGAAEWHERPGSVGRAIPPFEAFVLDEDGKPVPPGTRGRLYFRDTSGYGMRYLRGGVDDPFAGPGEFTLGEIGVMDEAGYVWITDRFADMVVSGGVNVYPAEAEAVLAAHPDVDEVVCIGIPHPDLGEQLIALVVPADPATPPDPGALLAHCQSNLTRYKCPRQLELVASLARTPVGKIDKRAIRAPYWSTVE